MMVTQSEALNWTSRFGFVDIQQRLELCRFISPETSVYVAIAQKQEVVFWTTRHVAPPYCDGVQHVTINDSLLVQVHWDQQSVSVVFSSKNLSANAY